MPLTSIRPRQTTGVSQPPALTLPADLTSTYYGLGGRVTRITRCWHRCQPAVNGSSRDDWGFRGAAPKRKILRRVRDDLGHRDLAVPDCADCAGATRRGCAMSSTHTPAPWRVGGNTGCVNQIAIEPTIGCAYGAGEEVLANARLMAAAPELYQLARLFLDYANSAENFNTRRGRCAHSTNCLPASTRRSHERHHPARFLDVGHPRAAVLRALAVLRLRGRGHRAGRGR